jgi:hypothetical protein
MNQHEHTTDAPVAVEDGAAGDQERADDAQEHADDAQEHADDAQEHADDASLFYDNPTSKKADEEGRALWERS